MVSRYSNQLPEPYSVAVIMNQLLREQYLIDAYSAALCSY